MGAPELHLKSAPRPHGPRALAVAGESMRPWLAPGDTVVCARRPPRPGDCVVFLGPAGGLVVHRFFLRVGGRCLTKGDFQLLPDRPLAVAAVTGVVVAARRGGRGLDLDSAGARRAGLALAAWAWPCVAAYRAAQFACWLGRVALDAARAPASAQAALELAPYALARALLTVAADIAAARLPDAVVPASEGARPAGGALDADQTWSGEVRLFGDVIVPRGVTLTLSPGCRVLDGGAKRVHHGARRRVEGEPRDADPRRPRLAVYGRLVAAGAPGRPVMLEGVGEIALYGGELDAAVLRVSATTRGLMALDGADARLRDCVFEDCTVAVEAAGGSSLLVAGLRAARAETALLVRERSRVAATELSVEACAAAVRVSGGARAELAGAALRDCGAGLSVDAAPSRLNVRGLRAERVTLALSAENGGRLDAADARLVDCAEAGRAALGGRLSARGLDAALSGDGALRAEASSLLRVSRARLSGAREGVVAAGGRLSARDLAASATHAGAAAREGGRLRLTRARLSARDVGVEVRGATAVLRASTARGRLFGATLDEGALRATRCVFQGGEAGGLLAAGASLTAADSRLRGGHGLIARGDAAAALRACRLSAREGHGLWLLDTARARLTDAVVRRAASAAALVADRAQLDADGFEARGAGLVVEGGAACVARLSVRGAATALSARGGSLTAKGWSARDGAAGASASGDGVLRLDDGLCANLTGWALALAGRAQANVTRARFASCGGGADVSESASLEGAALAVDSPSGHGLRARGDSRTVLRDSSVSGAGDAGVLLEERAKLELEDFLLDGCGLAATGGAAVLRRVNVLDAPGAAVDLAGGAHALEGCVIEGPSPALRAAGDAAATAADCSFSGCDGAAVVLAGRALLRVDLVRVERCGGGADLDERASLQGRDFIVLAATGQGLRLRGSSAADLERADVSGAADCAVLLEDDARLDLEGGRLEACAAGVSACGGSSRLRGVRLAGHRGADVDASAGAHSLEGCVLDGSLKGLVARADARARAEGSLFTGHAQADAAAGGRAALDLIGCRLRAGRAGLWAQDDSRVTAERCLFEGHSEPAVRLGQRARASLRANLFKREWMSVLAEDDAELDAADCVIRGGPTGFKLDGRARAALEDCRFRRLALDGVWVGRDAALRGTRCAFSVCRVAVQRHAAASVALDASSHAACDANERTFA